MAEPVPLGTRRYFWPPTSGTPLQDVAAQRPVCVVPLSEVTGMIGQVYGCGGDVRVWLGLTLLGCVFCTVAVLIFALTPFNGVTFALAVVALIYGLYWVLLGGVYALSAGECCARCCGFGVDSKSERKWAEKFEGGQRSWGYGSDVTYRWIVRTSDAFASKSFVEWAERKLHKKAKSFKFALVMLLLLPFFGAMSYLFLLVRGGFSIRGRGDYISLGSSPKDEWGLTATVIEYHSTDNNVGGGGGN